MIKTFASLFTGIGGFDLAARNCGLDIKFQCEINDYCNKILNKNFPNVQRFTDVKEMQALPFKGKIDLLGTGFPCQPFSSLGKQNAQEDERFLWDENLRIIKECEPKYIIAENVLGFKSLALEEVCISLENEEYTVWPIVLPAGATNADHIRYRVFVLAYSNKKRRKKRNVQSGKPVQNAQKKRTKRNTFSIVSSGNNGYAIQGISSSQRVRAVNGFPYWLDRIEALGNAVYVPLIEEIIKILIEFDNNR